MTEELPAPRTAQSYEDERQARVPSLYKTTHERLAVELAMKMDEPEDIFQRYGMTMDEGLALLSQPSFALILSRIGKEIAENGLSFKAKIKAIAEDLLPTAHSLASDPLTAATVRADIIKWAAKLAGHEPKESKEGTGIGQGGLTLSITFAGQPPMKVVQNEALTIEGN